MSTFDYNKIKGLTEDDKKHISLYGAAKESLDEIIFFANSKMNGCSSCKLIFAKLTKENPNMRMIY